ncbi:RNase H domain-containing protein [Trichonephila clavipes]|nr:RNase H domain-containing protein [Trichonephila clavipes]
MEQSISKKAITVHILKSNKPLDNLKNYQPISLTSILSKVMERVITYRLNWFLESNNLSFPTQGGFRKWMSKTQQVTLLIQYMKDALDQRCSVLAVFVDFEAAFDTVWRLKCIQKSQNLGVQ